MASPEAIYREGDEPEPVTPESPLEGLETEVLKVWLQSPNAAKAYRANPQPVEDAVRRAVFDALQQEASLKAQGLQPHEAREFTRPVMWKAPMFSTNQPQPSPVSSQKQIPT